MRGVMTRTRTLEDLFVDELFDLYDAETQLMTALPRLARAASSDAVRHTLDAHLDETRAHLERLDRVCAMWHRTPDGRHCAGMAGILAEAMHLADDVTIDEMARDAGIITSALRADHYQIVAYGTLVAWANHLGRTDVANVLARTLLEERAADVKWTLLAEGGLNVDAPDSAVPVLRQ